MGLNIEAAKNYTLSVAERTFGIEAYRKVREFAVSTRTDTTSSRIVGGMMSTLEIATPLAIQGIFIATIEADKQHKVISIPEALIKTYGGFGIDLGLGLLALSVSQNNIPEAIVLKLTFNAATHVGLDLASRAVDKITHFRPPSAATLAI